MPTASVKTSVCTFVSAKYSIHICNYQNIFDTLATLTAPKAAELRDELARYLSTDPEHTEDVLLWWAKRKSTFPHLSRMALDYISIPGKLSHR
jgi:hAT family C-terminal dimerisation region